MVVVVIIGVLAALFVPRFVGRIGQSKQAAARAKMSTIETAIGLFQTDSGRLPNTLDELVNRPSDLAAEQWQPSLRPKDLLDPWDQPYVYRVPGQNWQYDLYSLGADGQEGGEGEYADVVNWE